MVVNLLSSIEKSISFKTGVVDFEGHKFSCKLTRVSFDSWLNRFASFASFAIAHSSFNDSISMMLAVGTAKDF